MLADVAHWTFLSLEWLMVVPAFAWLFATIAAETRLPQWPVRMCDFPRAQIVVLAALTGVLYTVFAALGGWTWWHLLLPVIMLLCMLRQAMWIWPYVGPSEDDLHDATVALEDDSAIRLVISNVLQQNDKFDLWRRVIEDAQPDILACAETDEQWIGEIARSFDQSHPHQVKVPQDNMYGMSLWSKLPLERVEVERVVQDDIPSIHCNLKLADGQTVRLRVLHPRPPAPQEGDSSAPRDAELIIIARRIKDQRDAGGEDDLPNIVCGDLNDVAWSRTTRLFLKISGMLDPRRGRGLISSFDANKWWFRVPLDHVFVSREFRLIQFKRLDYTGSDHYPVLIDLSLEPDKEADQPPHEADADEEKDAAQLVEQQIDRERNGQENGNAAKNREAQEITKESES